MLCSNDHRQQGEPKAVSEETTISQNEDFAGFTIDGKRIEIDLYEAHERLVAVDIKHKDDPWKCLACFGTFQRDLKDESLECPLCHAKSETPTIMRDESYLDDVAEFIKSKGIERVSRRTAAMFYVCITEVIQGIKKKESQTPESPFGMGSTPRNGQGDESEPTSTFSLG